MWAPYRRVWRAPHVRPLVLASILGRLPIGIVSLALVLFVEDVAGSFAAAGGVVAAFALSSAVLSPAMGRAIDRRGQTVVLLAAAALHAAAVLSLVALGLAGASVAVLAACALAAGAMPPISSCLRPLWPGLLRDEPDLRTAAFALDSILIEAVFVVGPLTAAAIVAAASPAAALVVSAGLSLAGTGWFAAQRPSRRWRGEPAGDGLTGPLAAPGIRTLVAGAFAVGVCFGAMEVTLAAYGTERGRPSLLGVLFALQAIGSAAGGLWYGAHHARLGRTERGYLVLLVAAPGLIGLLAAAPTLGAIAALAIVSGLAVAPLTAAQNLLAGRLAPRGTLTEAYTWLVTAIVAGSAAGSGLAGPLVDAASWRAALACACGLALAVAAVSVARRRTLAEPA